MDEATQAIIDARFREIVRPLAGTHRRREPLVILLAGFACAMALAGTYAVDAIVVRGLAGL
jgi:hypothetical protein